MYDIAISNRDLRKILFFLLEGKKKKELEELEIPTIKQIKSTSPSKYKEILNDIYHKFTGKTLNKIEYFSILEYRVTKNGVSENKKEIRKTNIDITKLNVPSNVTLLEKYDLFTFHYIDKNNCVGKETIPHKFNRVDLVKNMIR